MASVDVIKCCLDSIRKISDEIKDSIVYLDAGSTESFQFLGAFPLFLELGALAVCSLEDMSSLDKVVHLSIKSGPAKRIVVITSRLLSDAHRYILRCLTTLQGVQHCAIYTAISEAGHSAYPDSPLGADAFHEYGSLLSQDYEELVKKQEADGGLPATSEPKGSAVAEDEGWSELTSIENEVSGSYDISSSKSLQKDMSIGYSEDREHTLVVIVHHFPLILSPFAPRVFVLPSEGSLSEACLSSEHDNSISSGLPPLSTGKFGDADDVTPGVALTAQFLHHLALEMDLKLEIFSLGDLSKNVGKHLTGMSSLYDGRRKKSAGLLLIDRTLDLLTPCCHGDSLVDRIFSSLPRRQRTTSLNQIRVSQTHLKTGPDKLERAPLDLQIPLKRILQEEDSTFRLLECIESFMHGWNTTDSDPQVLDLMKFSKKVNDSDCFKHVNEELLNGSFVSTDNFCGAPYLEAMLDRKTKDSAMLIKKWLQETLRKENISLDFKVRPGFPSKSDLQSMIKALSKKQSSLVKNKGIIQLAAATLHTLDEFHSANWDAFNSAEKILHVNSGDTTQSLAAQIVDLINKSAIVEKQSKTGIFTLQDALLLTIVGYILAGDSFPTSGPAGPFSWQEEHFMKEAIVDAILENPPVSRLKFLQGLSIELESNMNKTKSDEDPSDDFDFDDQWGTWGDDDDEDTSKDKAYNDMQLKLDLRDRVDNLFKFFHKLASMKRITPLLESKQSYDPYSSKGLLYRLLTSILNKQDVPGLEYHSSTVGRLLKSGFGRFGIGQAKPSLADQNVILAFVVGGINGVEVREVQEAITESTRPDIELILGGTTFLTPDNMRELLLGDYSHL